MLALINFKRIKAFFDNIKRSFRYAEHLAPSIPNNKTTKYSHLHR